MNGSLMKMLRSEIHRFSKANPATASRFACCSPSRNEKRLLPLMYGIFSSAATPMHQMRKPKHRQKPSTRNGKTVPKPKIPSANWLKNIRRTPQKKDSMKMYIQAKWLHPLMTGALMMHENQVIPALWKVPMDITFCISFRKTTRQPGRCWSTRI